MQVLSVSHLDHGLTEAQINYIKARFAGRDAFFIESFELPEGLGLCPSGLYGPAAGDAPVLDVDTYRATRGERSYESRMVDRPARLQRTVTVIAGPYKDAEGNEFSCVLYTAHGGPAAPREPGDPSLAGNDVGIIESVVFWRDHALAGR